MKYIDADRLRARIEKYLTFDNSIDTAFYIGRRDAERSILVLIDSLQQEQPEIFDSVAFQKGVQEGRRLEREDAKSTIQSRINEILGDAQPNPILRMELQELIKKIEA